LIFGKDNEVTEQKKYQKVSEQKLVFVIIEEVAHED